ncbi:hypothetical protein DFJ74DRAFT_12325 [Hyaloraphidium curvatum]|nr:hypothetical protein DFJ74DRAFT_12325 [Hyaloraphidium curvatum]
MTEHEEIVQVAEFPQLPDVEAEAPTDDERVLIAIVESSVAEEPWADLREIIKRQLEKNTKREENMLEPVDVIRQPEKLEDYFSRIWQTLDALDEAPFTIQRLAELLTVSKATYPLVFKYLRAIEKCLSAVSPQSRTLLPDAGGVEMDLVPDRTVVVMNDPDLGPPTAEQFLGPNGDLDVVTRLPMAMSAGPNIVEAQLAALDVSEAGGTPPEVPMAGGSPNLLDPENDPADTDGSKRKMELDQDGSPPDGQSPVVVDEDVGRPPDRPELESMIPEPPSDDGAMDLT